MIIGRTWFNFLKKWTHRIDVTRRPNIDQACESASKNILQRDSIFLTTRPFPLLIEIQLKFQGGLFGLLKLVDVEAKMSQMLPKKRITDTFILGITVNIGVSIMDSAQFDKDRKAWWFGVSFGVTVA